MSKSLIQSFTKYTFVGAFATFIHYAIFLISIHFFSSIPWKATMFGAAGGALIAYILNYHHTFLSHAKHSVLLPKFLIVASFGVLIQTLIVAIFTPQIHYLLAQLIATAVGLILTFMINRFWTFV